MRGQLLLLGLGLGLGPLDTRADSVEPCADAAYRALDFWLGSWTVRDGGKAVGESRITRLAAGCAVLESYAQADGYAGKSLNYVDPQDGRWRQLWLDSGGNVSEFSGGPGAAGLELRGETRSPRRRVLRQMTLSALPSGRVRQSSLVSRDEGRSFEPLYDLEYVPA